MILTSLGYYDMKFLRLRELCEYFFASNKRSIVYKSSSDNVWRQDVLVENCYSWSFLGCPASVLPGICSAWVGLWSWDPSCWFEIYFKTDLFSFGDRRVSWHQIKMNANISSVDNDTQISLYIWTHILFHYTQRAHNHLKILQFSWRSVL